MKNIAGCISYYKTDKENEYINSDGDSIFRFNKITKKKYFIILIQLENLKMINGLILKYLKHQI